MVKRTEVLVQPYSSFWRVKTNTDLIYACSMHTIWNLNDFSEIRICASDTYTRGGIKVWLDYEHDGRVLDYLMYQLGNWSKNSFPKAKSLWFWIEEA